MSGTNIEEGQVMPKSLHLSLCEDEQHRILHNLDKSVRRFWEIESIPEIKIRSEDEQLAEDIFTASHSRNSNGRYCVNILFKSNAPLMGNSRQITIKRFLQLENQLKKNSEKLTKND